MKKNKDSIVANNLSVGGFRAEAQEYNHIITDYIQRLVVIKELNEKRKYSW